MSESKHTKQEFEKGWKHLLTCINFDKSCFDAEAIRFMNEFPGKIMDVLDSYDKLLKACKAVLKDVVPVGVSQASKGQYLGMFTIHGNKLEDVFAAIAEAEKGA